MRVSRSRDEGCVRANRSRDVVSVSVGVVTQGNLRVSRSRGDKRVSRSRNTKQCTRDS